MTALPTAATAGVNQRAIMPTRDMPNTDAVSALPKNHRVSAQKLAQYINLQYEHGLTLRRPHAVKWIQVKSIMRNVHYFSMDGGVWRPIRKKLGEIRAVRKIMRPRYRWELGRLNANTIGANVTARPGEGDRAFYHAEVARAMLANWIIEENIQRKANQSHQNVLFWGRAGLFRYIDTFNKTVKVQVVPGTEYFPLPFDAPSLEEADGLMRVQFVTKQWLETQDDALLERLISEGSKKKGDKLDHPMAVEATEVNTRMSVGLPGLGGPASSVGTNEGATIKQVWMKPNSTNRQGLWMLFVGDKMFRFKGEEDENGKVLFNDNIPHEFINYQEHPDDFWPVGFCEDLYSEQIEANRQLTDIIINARRNRGFTVFDSEQIDVKDMQSEVTTMIPARGGAFEQRPPIMHVPPNSLSRDVGAILALVEQGADKAIGYESGIIVGKQEGRTEGGPATNLLNTNAQIPLGPVVDSVYGAWERTFPDVLDMLKTVWPESKTVKSTQGLMRHLVIKRDQIPSSKQVSIKPQPIVPGGRNTMMQLLFQLRGMPDDDNKGFVVKSRELVRSLEIMGFNPPGVSLVDEKEQRINDRLNLIINDGQKPGIPGPDQSPELRFENHTLAVELIKDKILDPAYKFFGPEVQIALLNELEYHTELLPMGFQHPSAFDDDVEDEDARLSERTGKAQEDDLSTSVGEFIVDGAPVTQ